MQKELFLTELRGKHADCNDFSLFLGVGSGRKREEKEGGRRRKKLRAAGAHQHAGGGTSEART
jgi:hypothetical protein